MRLLKQVGAVALVAFIGRVGFAAAGGGAVGALVSGVATALLALLVYRWVVRRTERREPVEVARAGAGRGIVRGVLIGVGMFVAVIANIALFAEYQVTGFGSVTGAVAIFGLMAAAAVTEELLFRGVLLRIIEERGGTWLALGVTGVAFGLIHLFNENASLWGAIAIAISAGLMLAAAYVATRSLWVPIGLHFGWNFAAGGIFSAVVSGNGVSEGLLETTASGPALITGGTFGPEASLYTILAGALLTVGFLWLAHRRGHLVSRRRGDLASRRRREVLVTAG